MQDGDYVGRGAGLRGKGQRWVWKRPVRVEDAWEPPSSQAYLTDAVALPASLQPPLLQATGCCSHWTLGKMESGTGGQQHLQRACALIPPSPSWSWQAMP